MQPEIGRGDFVAGVSDVADTVNNARQLRDDKLLEGGLGRPFPPAQEQGLARLWQPGPGEVSTMDKRIEGQSNNDLNRNGIDDEIEPPTVDITASRSQLAERLRQNPGTNPTLSGGDIDARWEEAESAGDESVGGSTAVPGQNDVDDLGRAVGVTYADGEELGAGEKPRRRDEHRWERDPASSEDYSTRTTPEK